eukprot:403356768
MLLALLLPAHFAMAQDLVGQPKEPITAAMYGDDTKSDIADLYHISEQFVDGICVKNGKRPGCWQWVDLEGNNDRESKFGKVVVIAYDEPTYSSKTRIDKPGKIFEQGYCNQLEKDTTFVFETTYSASSTCSWSVTQGMTFTSSISASIGIPFVSAEVKEKLVLDYSTTNSQEYKHAESQTFTYNIPAPGKTQVNATILANDINYQADWTANITMQGCVNARFHDRIQGEYIWWYGIAQVFGNVQGFKCWETKVPDIDYCLNQFCTFQAKGTYTGLGGVASALKQEVGPCGTDKLESFLQ